MKSGLEHISKRKRISKKIDIYPSKRLFVRLLDRLLVFVALIAPLFSIPQILKIYSSGSAGDLSLYSWLVWTIFDIPWLIYGIVHKEKPIILAYTLWFFTNLSVVIGILLYS